MNFNDEFYSRIKESPNNKTEVNKTINNANEVCGINILG